MKTQPQQRQVLVHQGVRWQALETPAKVVAEVSDQTPGERRPVGRSRGPTPEPQQHGPRLRERVRTLGGSIKDQHGVRGQVGPAPGPTGSGTLEQDEARELAERLRDIERREAVQHAEALQQRLGAAPVAALCRTGFRDRVHPAMIGGPHHGGRDEAGGTVGARELGIRIGRLTPGENDAITDVPGVLVGHTTLVAGDGPLVVGRGPVRTGVTVVVPHGDDVWTEPLFAGCHRLNGNGELTGLEWVRESGLLGGVIGITNTHSVGVVRDALVRHAARDPSNESTFWSLPVVGETYDGAPQRHERVPCAARAPGFRTCRRGRRTGCGRQRGRRHRHDLPRVQGRHRDGVPGDPGGRRWLDRRCPGPGELWFARPAADRRGAGRRGHSQQRGSQPLG